MLTSLEAGRYELTLICVSDQRSVALRTGGGASLGEADIVTNAKEGRRLGEDRLSCEEEMGNGMRRDGMGRAR